MNILIVSNTLYLFIGFQPDGNGKLLVLAPVGKRHIPGRVGGNRDHITIMPNISAAGAVGPSMLIFKGKHILKNMLDERDEELQLQLAVGEAGYMDSELFSKFLEHFDSNVDGKHVKYL